MALPRPFGVGPYSAGPYSRYADVFVDVGGASLLLFGVKAFGAQRILHAEAVSQIVFDAWTEHLDRNWFFPPPCEPGTWAPADPCETGGWDAVPSCSTGTWAPKR